MSCLLHPQTDGDFLVASLFIILVVVVVVVVEEEFGI